MPRKPRFVLPGVPLHVVQRGNNRDPIFFDESDYAAYLKWLGEAAERYGCAVHAYVLMTNHVHVLVTPGDSDGVSRMMQYLGRKYVPYINHSYGTTGTLWEGRFKASLIDAEGYLFSCMRYIELNPVRAAMVKSPAHYRWSSYRANAQGKEDALITPHARYLALGRTAEARSEAYRALFKSSLSEAELTDLRAAWQTGTPLGNERFKEKIETKLGVRVGYAARGRPKSAPIDT